MFGTLFQKECKQILRSMVYYLYVVIFVMFLSSQLGEVVTADLERPEPGQESYGSVSSHEESAVMEKVLAGLVLETYHNSYATYPMGFYRGVWKSGCRGVRRTAPPLLMKASRRKAGSY